MKPAVLDIVVVNHKTPEDLAACLGSLAAFPPSVPHTVTIVHVCPELLDLEITEFFMSADHGDGYWLEQTWGANVGYNVACNVAAAAREAPYIAFLNADTMATPGAFDRLVDALEDWRSRGKGWGIVGPRQVNGNNKLTAAGTIGTNEAHTLRGWQEQDQGQYSEIQDDAVYVAGSFLIMRRSVFDELTACSLYAGLVNAPGPWGDFKHYFGDQWLGFHARAHGHLCVYYGPVTVHHEWHKASPLGGYAEATWQRDRDRFVELCIAHGIEYNP